MMTKEMLAKAIAAKKADPSIGRPRLIALTGCTRWDAQQFLAKHGRGLRPGQKKGEPHTKPKPEVPVKQETMEIEGGIHLHQTTRICERRPPVTVRSKFFMLPKNKAFKVAELSRQWGFSVETVKRHAKDEGCFAYIDTTGHDDFEECVMHPETAAARLKG
jgi:hypothetical protein